MEESPAPIEKMYPRELPNASERREANDAVTKLTGARSGQFSRSMAGWILIISVGLLLFFIVHIHEGTNGSTEQAASEHRWAIYQTMGLIGFGLGVALVLTTFLGFYLWGRWSGIQVIGLLPRMQEYGWCKRGIYWKDSGREIGTAWKKYIGHVETPRTFVLLVTGSYGEAIPKRGLGGMAMEDLFRSTLNQHLSRVGGATL